jgi:D-alanyl-D-alanine dipeptidase
MRLLTYLALLATVLSSLSVRGQDCAHTAATDIRLRKLGLKDVRTVDSTIQVDLRFSGTNNPLRKDAYGDFCNCYLQAPAADKLAKAQQLLRKRQPGYSLLLYDCLRPRSFQRTLYSLVEGTSYQHYVANPTTGSMHNYGCAVDVTVVDSQGIELDMGTLYCDFGDLVQPRKEQTFLEQGKLTQQQLDNRLLLRTAMTEAGFRQLPIEWWHFDAFDKDYVRRTYKAIE